MSTVSAPPVAAAGHAEKAAAKASIRHFLLRRLHSLTGLLFGGYIVVHLIVNATLIQGQHPSDVFQEQVNKIHGLPFLLAIEWTFIFLPIIFHTVYGIWITLRAEPNPGHYPYAKNIFYTLQRVSAMIIVAFMIFHVLGMKGFFGAALEFDGDPGKAAWSTARHINCNWAVAYLVYPLGVLASCYHLANGFWTAAITWGLTVSKAAQRRWGYVCVGIFGLTFVCGMLALVGSIKIKGLSPEQLYPAEGGTSPKAALHIPAGK